MRTHTPTLRSAAPVFAALAAAAAFFGTERDVHAQSTPRFGERGQFSITAEDVFGYRTRTVTIHDPNGNTRDTTNSFGFGLTTEGAQAGFHYFVIDGLSLGGTIGYESRGGEQTCGRGDCDKLSGSTFKLAPRIGYALMLSDLLGFWFRGGPAYVTSSEHTDANHSDAKTSASFWTLGADAWFVVTPISHVGFYVGPTYDFSISGTVEAKVWVPGLGGGGYQSYSRDADAHRFSFDVGAIAFF